MPYKFQWLVPHRVILSQGIGVMPIEEIQELNAHSIKYIRAGYRETGLRVHLFGDTHQVVKQPSAVELRPVFTYMAEPGLGEVVIAGRGNPLIQFIANFVGKAFNAKITMYDTTEQALATLQAHYPDLPDLRATYCQLMSK